MVENLKACMKMIKKSSADAWFGLLRPSKDDCGLHASQLVSSQFAGDDGAVGGEKANSSRFDHVLDQYPDVFGTPGMPPDREVTHRIDLVDEEA